MKRLRREKEKKLIYPVKMFKGDYVRALKKCRDLSKEGESKIYLADVLRGFVSWIAREDIEKKDRKELDKLITTIGDHGNLLKRGKYGKE